MLTTRIVLNVREASNQGSKTELHATFLDAPVFAQVQHVTDGTDWSQSVTDSQTMDGNDGTAEYIQLQYRTNLVE